MTLEGLRIGLLTASASRLGGGVFEAVVQQAAMIRDLGGNARIFALADRHSADDRHRFGPSPVTFSRVRGPVQIGHAPDLVGELLAADLDCLHLQGIWMYPSHAAQRWARRTGRPYFVSPHGMLDPWITARGRWKKALARIGYERASWRAATALHALSAKESADIFRESGRRDSVVIPNPAPLLAPNITSRRLPHLLYIGRIHPKKNVLALVEAWSRARVPVEARLTIAGWGDPADIAALETAVAAGPRSVQFVGPVFDQAKQDLL
ncbi:MAG: glycosyltransferase [Croceibacterium sp.]